MTDLLFRGADYDTFLLEASQKSPKLVHVDNNGGIHAVYPKTPMVTNESGEFMFLVRATETQVGLFARCQSITNMGNYESVFNNPSKLEDYKRISPYHMPLDYVDENGNPQQYSRPQKIGVFA